VVVPRSSAIQAAEDDLGNALVAMVGGTRPDVSTAMVYTMLFDRFGIAADEVDVRRHAPEDFVVRFHHQADRDRVLGSRPSGHLPLVWRAWRRTSLACAGSFRFRVVLAVSRLPLHARNTSVVQSILGSCCSNIELTHTRDAPVDDDREFFVIAWCWHPNLIEREKVIFISEPRLPGVAAEERMAEPGLRYLVRVRLVAYQDWSTPPGSPNNRSGDAGNNDDSHSEDDNGSADDDGEPTHPHDDVDYPFRRDCDSGDSGDSNYNGVDPGMDRCGDGELPSLQVGQLYCPLSSEHARGPRRFDARKTDPVIPTEHCSADRHPLGGSRRLDVDVSVYSSSGPGGTPGDWPRWPTESAPCTPKIFNHPSRTTDLTSPGLTKARDPKASHVGVVGSFLKTAPLLLHAGTCAQQPTQEHHDWWADHVEGEFGPSPPAVQGAPLEPPDSPHDWWADLVQTELHGPLRREAGSAVPAAPLRSELPTDTDAPGPGCLVSTANELL